MTREFDPQCKFWIVGQYCSGAYENRVVLGSQKLRAISGLLVCNPLREACARSRLAVQRHGGLQMNEGSFRSYKLNELFIQLARLRFAYSDLDVDSMRSQYVDASSAD